MKLCQLTFMKKRTETSYDAESTNKFSDELNKELTDETGCFNFLTYEQKFDELQSDSADFVTTARGKAIAPTSGATKELRTSSTEKSEARRVTVSINTHDVPEWPAHTESVDGATKDGNTCSKGFQDRSLNGKCMLVDSATCCACNQGMENWYAKCRRKQ